MSEDKPQALPPQVIEALGRGQKIEAVKLLRESARLGLKEAKEAVDAYALAHPAVHSATVVESGEGLGVGRWLFVLLVLGAGLAWLLLEGGAG